MKRILLLAAFAPTAALAHPGHDFGLAAGLLHPLTGADHVLAMICVGLCAAQIGGASRWALPATFLAAMALGGLAAWTTGMGAAAAAIEPAILASLIVLGALAAAMLQLPLAVTLPLVALFGVAHGAAHGLEGAGLPFAGGMLAATAALHGLGLVLGRLPAFAQRLTGALTLTAGVALALAG